MLWEVPRDPDAISGEGNGNALDDAPLVRACRDPRARRDESERLFPGAI